MSNLFYSIKYSWQTRLLRINLVQKDDPEILFKTGDYLTVDEDTSISEWSRWINEITLFRDVSTSERNFANRIKAMSTVGKSVCLK